MADLFISYRTPNLGDDIQTLAQIVCQRGTMEVDLQQLTYIDRDWPDVPAGRHRLVINCWYSLSTRPRGFPSEIEQQVQSIHLRYAPGKIPPDVIYWLKRLEPVGCRDLYTRQLLSDVGIQAHFSCCPTLGIRQRDLQTDRHGRLLVVDARPPLSIPHGFQRLTHQLTPDQQRTMGPVDRLSTARSLLRLYAGARAVITSRIHCAFPCIGLGVPVYFVPDDRDPSRFGGYEALLEHQRRMFAESQGFDPLEGT